MAKSPRYVDRYTEIRKSTQPYVDAQKAAMDEHDKALSRFKIKERLAMLGYWTCVAVTVGLFLYTLYNRQP